MLTVHQIDERGLLQWSASAHEKGHLQVLVMPPEAPAGHIQQWVTDLHPVIDALAYGTAGTGNWEVIEDHQKDNLWLEHGKRYTLGEDHGGESYDGLGPLPEWLHTEEPPAPEPTLQEAQDAQLALINTAFGQAAAALTEGYPEAERLTWPIQQTEALAWAADDTAPTPYLDGLAAARDITPTEMRTLTLAQVQAFQAASQTLVGTRQRLRDEILEAETVEEVRDVVWPSGSEA